LAHTAIFDNDDPGLKLLYDEWYKDGELDFVSFWQEVAPDWVCLVSLSDQSLLERDNKKFEGFPRYHYESIEWFRVTQVAVIVRNLSFNNSNAQFFAQSDVLLKFLFLSVNCYVPHVKACALDTLVNISSFVSYLLIM
jgi:AT-rich interactive domain-containing protein 2